MDELWYGGFVKYFVYDVHGRVMVGFGGVVMMWVWMGW